MILHYIFFTGHGFGINVQQAALISDKQSLEISYNNLVVLIS